MGLGITINTMAIGPSDPFLESASLVEVHERLGEPTTFRLRYAMDVDSRDFPLLTDGRLGVGTNIAILAPDAFGASCLVRGVVHAQQVHFEHGGAGSWLEVQGSDRLVLMDRESKSTAWTGTASTAAMTILAGYQFIPDVQPTTTAYSMQTHELVQRDSDYRFLRRLARRHGYLLWTTCNQVGIETAHFKPAPVSDPASAELGVNVSPNSLASFDLSWDVERPTSVEALQLDLGTLSDVNGAATTPLSNLGTTPLAGIATGTRSIFLAAPADDAGSLTARGEGALVDADLFLRGNCRTSVAQLGAVVRAHTVVNVNGLGSRHSGNYLVSAVRHTIDAAMHRMDVELLRNGWGS